MSRPLNSEIVARLQLIADSCPVIWEVSSAIAGITSIHTDDWEIEITEEEQTALLKAFTGSVVVLNVIISCYPLGVATFVLFDSDGNPL